MVGEENRHVMEREQRNFVGVVFSLSVVKIC